MGSKKEKAWALGEGDSSAVKRESTAVYYDCLTIIKNLKIIMSSFKKISTFFMYKFSSPLETGNLKVVTVTGLWPSNRPHNSVKYGGHLKIWNEVNERSQQIGF